MVAPLYMDAVIRPNRSLPLLGFKVLIGALLVVNLLVGGMFWMMGAAIVPIFLGLDVLAVWIAFRVSYRRGEWSEHVQVSAETISVFTEAAGRRTMVWRSPTAFTRVAVDDLGEAEWRVRLHLSDQRHTVAKALSPQERADFGQALKDAIQAARSERYAAPA